MIILLNFKYVVNEIKNVCFIHCRCNVGAQIALLE